MSDLICSSVCVVCGGAAQRSFPFNSKRARGSNDDGSTEGTLLSALSSASASAAASASASAAASKPVSESEALVGVSAGSGAGPSDAAEHALLTDGSAALASVEEVGRGPIDCVLHREEVFATDWDSGCVRVFQKRTGQFVVRCAAMCCAVVWCEPKLRL